MGSALALASVTAVLKHLLENGLVERGVAADIGGEVVVSTQAPDRITTGADERTQLNLFLYQITPNTGLRPSDSSVAAKENKLVPKAPLALDLYYLITAYGAQDFHTEILLGATLQVLHETSVLTKEAMRAALRSVSSTNGGRVVMPALQALAASDLAERVEHVTLKPQFLNAEEQTRLWSALQARYRPSAVYKAATAFIDERR